MFEMRRNSVESDNGRNDGKCCYNLIPTRFVFVLLGFIGFNLIYSYKVVLSVAIVAMVGHGESNSDFSEECKATHNETNPSMYSTTTSSLTTLKPTDDKFDWTPSQSNSVLGAFFYGYVLTQLPMGIMAERFGAKWIFGISVLLTAILSLLSPIAAKLNYYAYFAVRVSQGLAEGGVFPIMNTMLAKWLPKMERSLGSTIVFTGAQIGTVITMPVAGILCDGTFMGGWPSIFYLLGIVGCIWFVLWSIFVFESPDTHPYISSKELIFIKKGQGQEVGKKRPSIPVKKVATSVPVWAIVVTHFCQNWEYLTVLTLLPTYFEKILLMDIKSNGLMSSLPWLTCALVSWVVGMVSDKVRASGKIKITVIRKFCNTVAYLGPAICLVAVVFSKCNSTANISLFILAMGLNGFIFSGLMCTHVDMAPDFAGTLMGLTNSIGNIPGFVAPIVANAFTEHEGSLRTWSYVFYVSAGVYAFGAFVYLFFASAKLQDWAKNNQETQLNGIVDANGKPLTDNYPTEYNNKGFTTD